MNLETVKRLTASGRQIDLQSSGAAMQLAWHATASHFWSARDFNAPANEVRAVFAEKLCSAWALVKAARDAAQRAERASTQLADLNYRKQMLQNKPFQQKIRAELDEINREILATLENA